MHNNKSLLDKSQKIVIKVGSSIIVDNDRPNKAWLQSLAENIHELKGQGKKIIIVSSGAIGLGKNKLGKNKPELKLSEKQAAAACGQVALVESYQKAFQEFGIEVAQILLTLDDSEDRRRYLNARNTIETLLETGIIPIINENDTVATVEIRVGDNDRLAARVAQMVGADTLVLLSDVDGLYDSDPNKNPQAQHIAEVQEINEKIEEMAAGDAGVLGTGGMATKVQAAKIAMNSGCRTIITYGKQNDPLKDVGTRRNTVFIPDTNPDKARKIWISESLAPKGSVMIDDGAVEALYNQSSLLPAGVVSVDGDFDRGDMILIKNQAGQEIARGLSAYSTVDAKKIIGRQSSEIPEILGFSGREELVHRNDLFIKQ